MLKVLSFGIRFNCLIFLILGLGPCLLAEFGRLHNYNILVDNLTGVFGYDESDSDSRPMPKRKRGNVINLDSD